MSFEPRIYAERPDEERDLAARESGGMPRVRRAWSYEPESARLPDADAEFAAADDADFELPDHLAELASQLSADADRLAACYPPRVPLATFDLSLAKGESSPIEAASVPSPPHATLLPTQLIALTCLTLLVVVGGGSLIWSHDQGAAAPQVAGQPAPAAAAGANSGEIPAVAASDRPGVAADPPMEFLATRPAAGLERSGQELSGDWRLASPTAAPNSSLDTLSGPELEGLLDLLELQTAEKPRLSL